MRFHSKIGFIFIIIIMIAVPTAYASLWDEIPFEEMVESADLIVIIGGYEKVDEVIEEEPAADREREVGRGFTEWEVEVQSYLKGEPVGGRLLVVTPGATVAGDDGTMRSVMGFGLDDAVRELERELGVEVGEVLLFLEEGDGELWPMTPKAIVPLVVLDWEEYLTPELIGEEEIDFEDESFEDLRFLKEYVEAAPRFSPEGELLKGEGPGQTSTWWWLWFVVSFLVIVVGAFLWIWMKRRRG